MATDSFAEPSPQTLAPTLPDDVERLAGPVAWRASERGLRLVTAESCTGGLLASMITDVEGCAHVLERGFVTYSEESKAQLLGLDPRLPPRSGRYPIARSRIDRAVRRQAIRTARNRICRGALAASEGDLAGPGQPCNAIGRFASFGGLSGARWVTQTSFNAS